MIVLPLFVAPVLAAPQAIDFSALFAQLIAAYGPPVTLLVLLIVVDLTLGVASALKRRVFEWKKVGDFYTTNVLPKLIGWIALTILSYALTQAALPPEIAAVLAPLSAGLAYLLVLASLGASILSNYQELFGPPPGGASQPPAPTV